MKTEQRQLKAMLEAIAEYKRNNAPLEPAKHPLVIAIAWALWPWAELRGDAYA